jgi:hypothetical protein
MLQSIAFRRCVAEENKGQARTGYRYRCMSDQSDYGDDDIDWDNADLHKQLASLEQDTTRPKQSTASNRELNHIAVAIETNNGSAGRQNAGTFDPTQAADEQQGTAAATSVPIGESSLW